MPLGLEAVPLWVMGCGHRGDAVDGASAWRACPGAVLHIPAMPTAAFLLMVAGGLWLALWQTRWRLLGRGADRGRHRAGADAAPARSAGRPRRRARRRARRTTGGWRRWGRARAFELERWLEHDGDARTPQEAAKAAAFACDAGRLPGDGQGADGGGRAASGRVLRRLPARRHRGLEHRQPEKLHAAQGGRRFLRRAPRGHARDLHRGGREACASRPWRGCAGSARGRRAAAESAGCRHPARAAEA